MNWRSFIIGSAVGGLVVGCAIFLSTGYTVLDQGITITYAYDEQDTLRRESDVLKAMAEPHWLNLSQQDALKRLRDLGLFDFEKGSDGIAAGPVYLKLAEGQVVEIQTHCARMQTYSCTQEGVNRDAN